MAPVDPDATRAARLLHHRAAGLTKGAALAPAILPAVTFHLPEVEGAAHIYGRNGQPGWDEVEAQLALLEDAPCVSFPSGMGAISAALMATLRAGGHVVLPSDGYYVTRVLAREFLAGFGVTVTEIPTLAYATHDFTGVTVAYLETPSNPGLDVVDIRAVAARAHAEGAVVIADNTTMTPLLQRPLDLGADMVVAADTKAPAGHSDVLFGHVATRDPALLQRVRDWRRLSGAVPGPFEAWMVHRGIETLEVRLSRMCSTAQVIAERLAADGRVQGLRYPGLPSDPAHAVAKAQMSGFGFLIGFTLPDAARAEAFLSACPYLAQTTSFGGVHSSGERRARWGDPVAPGYIRLSVGLEPAEALWDAMAGALDTALA